MKILNMSIHRWLMMAIPIVALTACSQDEEPAPADTPVRLQVQAGIMQRQAADTRASIADDGSGSFEEGDEITVTRQNDGESISYIYKGSGTWEPSDGSDGFYMHSYEETYTAYYANPKNPEDPLVASDKTTMDDTKVDFKFTHQRAKIIITFIRYNGCSYSIVGLGEDYGKASTIDSDDYAITLYLNPSDVSSIAIDVTNQGTVIRHIISLADIKANMCYTYTVQSGSV
jgi:hypothetical protein